MAHVFISYVRENQRTVDRLADQLRTFGVEVWLDRERIQPGERWRVAIRNAIRSGALFVACFSREWAGKSKSYMNEELTLAIDELRQRQTNRAWFVPVRLDGHSIPDRDIGGGETLHDLQWLDLTLNWDDGVRQIVRAAVSDTLGEVSKVNSQVIRPLSSAPNLDETESSATEARRELYFVETLKLRGFDPCSEVRSLLYDDIESLVTSPPKGRRLSAIELLAETITQTRRRFPAGGLNYQWDHAENLLRKLFEKHLVLLGSDGEGLPPTLRNLSKPVFQMAADWRLWLDGELILELVRGKVRLEIQDIPALTQALRPPINKGNETYLVAVVDHLLRNVSLRIPSLPPYFLTLAAEAG